MTDPAPPARTPLTPEERAAHVVHGGSEPPHICLAPSAGRRWDGLCLPCAEASDAIRAAEAQAFAEGRLAGLREAAAEADDCWHGPGDHGCYHGREIAKAIRGLAEDALKAPKTQADPGPR